MNKTDLITNINTFFATTGNRTITAAQLRTVLTDVVNSYPNLTDDANKLNVGEYDATKTYPEGSIVINDGSFLIATAQTTGAFDAAKWIAFPMRACVLAVTKWTAGTYSSGDIRRHHYRLYQSLTAGNTQEPGTGGNWSEIQVFQPAGLNEYVTNRYYQDGDIVLASGIIYRRSGDGYSTDIAADITNSKFVIRQAVNDRLKLVVQKSAMTNGLITFAAILPAGVVFRSVKSKLINAFSGGGNTSATLKVYHTSTVVGNQLLTGDVFTGAATYMVNTSMNTLPSNTSASDVIVQVVVDNWAEITGGEVHLFIDYTIAQL